MAEGGGGRGKQDGRTGRHTRHKGKIGMYIVIFMYYLYLCIGQAATFAIDFLRRRVVLERECGKGLS